MAGDPAVPLVVPDTAVVLKWYLHQDEPDRDRALALRHAYLLGALRVLVPDLLPYEVANVLRYKPHWDASQVAHAIAGLFALKLEVVPISPAMLQRAVTLAYEHAVTVYDATFVAVAEAAGAEFITADDKLALRLTSLDWVRRLSSLPPVDPRDPT